MIKFIEKHIDKINFLFITIAIIGILLCFYEMIKILTFNFTI